MKLTRERRAGLEAVAAVLAAATLTACATMGSITKGTADSPAHSWAPPAGKNPAPSAALAPVVPAELQAPGRAWTLDEIVDIGLANNPQSRAAWNAARVASAAATAALGAYLPEIDANVTAAKQKAVFAGGQFIVDQTTLTPAATLRLLLFDFGGREASVRAARRALEAANWTHNSVLQTVLLRIESAYYQYLTAKALLEAQEVTRKGAEANHEAAQVRHQAGVATVADVLQAKTGLSAIDLEIVATRGLIQTLHGALASAMGLPAATPFEVSEKLPDAIDFACVDEQIELCIQDALAKRPDLAAARAQAREAEEGVRKARSTFFPTLSLSGDIGRIYYKGRPNSNPFYAISVSLGLPFLFGFQEYAVLAAKAQAEAARDEATGLGREVELQVWTSYYGLKTAEQEIATARDLLASAQASYDVALGRYKEGVGSILDLLSAQSLLENGRVENVRARSDWFQALVQFAHDTGALEPGALPASPGRSQGPGKGDRRP
ncbi:MAG TPA: TolC family protein [Acidobacteriota bacterium]|nr:TolC family protein [Acidobacteriota bacterium]